MDDDGLVAAARMVSDATPPVERAADHEAVYAAEREAFAGTDLEQRISFDRAVAIVTSIAATEWWPGPDLHVVRARRDAGSSSARAGGDGLVAIHLAEAQLSVATVLHEVAHALAGVDVGHGPRYRRALLDVVLVASNVDSTDRRGTIHVTQLAAAFVASRLTTGERAWTAPPDELRGSAYAL